jgi:hypothetical protein
MKIGNQLKFVFFFKLERREEKSAALIKEEKYRYMVGLFVN